MAEQLQHLIELLAGAHTREEVLAAALGPAIAALDALSGTMLLLDATGQWLNVAARQGYRDDQTVWQDGPLDPELPSGDAVLRQQVLYFEHFGEMTAAYPQLEGKTDGVAAIGSALLPLVLDGHALGVLILDFREPHAFTDEERRFLPMLARQTSVALHRAHLLSQRELEADRFRRMVEVSPIGMAVGALNGQLTLVNDAYLALLGYTRAEYEAGEIDWQALTPEAYRAQDRQAFEAAFSQGVSTTFEKEMLTKTGERLPLELTLIRHDAEQVVGYLKDLRFQRAQVQAVATQAALLQAEQHASQAFMTFTEAASRTTDVDELAQLALRLLPGVVPGSSVGFYERKGDSWHARHLSMDMVPELRAVLLTGVVARTPSFSEMVQTRTPMFIDQWNGQEQGIEHSGAYGQVALYPVLYGGVVGAALTMGLRDRGPWSDRERDAVLAVGRSFSLLYDRIAAAEQLRSQREEAERRSKALEAFALLSRDLAEETNRYALIRQAQSIILSLLTPGYALYWEEAGDHWTLKAQMGDIGDPALQRLVDEQGLPLETPAFHSTWLTGVPNYQDNYAQGADTPAELIRHVQAATAFRVEVQGRPVGMLAIGLFDQRSWTPMDRAVLGTALYSLGLMLERARSVEVLAERTVQLEASNEELRAANEELEAFTYSASHDLRTPVRHVMGFAELAEKALEKTPNDKAQQYLGTVKQAATRMTALIDGMLLLSRSGRQELQVQPVDLNLLVTQARHDVATEFGIRPVRWQVGDLPSVQGDREMLQQVMTNLLSNAVKYSARQAVSEVRVWGEVSATAYTVRVQDNGIGFDDAYSKKLFGIFQRLHSEKEFKGTGVGLATVKRIVQKHGGRVFAESDGHSGSTFGFTLPK